MTLQEQLRVDLKIAMKARDSDRTWAIRILMGEFGRQAEKELSDEQIVSIIKKLIKSERELLAAKGGEDTSPFMLVMEEYLPKQATEEEIRAWVEENIDLSAFGNRMQAMKPIMQHFGSTVDGNAVKKVLNSL